MSRYPRLQLAVWLVWSLFVVYCLYRLIEEPLVNALGAIAIASVSLLPAYLWTKDYVSGLPILPLHSLALLWTYGLPLVAGHPEISNYDASEIVFAAFCVALYTTAAGVVWFWVGKRVSDSRAHYYVLPEGRGFAFFVISILSGSLFTVAALSEAIDLDPGLYGIVRSSILALTSVALFVLGTRLGRGELSPIKASLFLLATACFIVVQLGTLFLIGAIVSVASALIGFTIGRGKVPWIAMLIALLAFGFLHSGKSEMRQRYWGADSSPIAFYEWPRFFAEWLGAGVDELTGSESVAGAQAIYERVSLMHLLLLAQRNTPQFVPYLDGATYAIIPRLLVPRFFDPDKPSSHQGTAILNIHYGLQTEEDTQGTTIGWGLLNEAFANFGLTGVVGIAGLIGLLFGLIGRFTVGAPGMSLENIIGVTFCAVAIQAEFTMAVFATVVFQSLFVVLLIIPFLDKRSAAEAA